MKKVLIKTNLIPLIFIFVALIFVSGVLSYAWYIVSTDTEDTLHLQADGAQIIMFEAEVSASAIEGTLYPARATKEAYINGTIPQVPQVIADGEGVLPSYLKRAAGIATFGTNLTYEAEQHAGRIRLDVNATATIKNGPSSRNLINTNELAVDYQFQIQEFALTLDEDGMFNIRGVSFPENSTIYRRGTKNFYSKISEYVPATGDRIIYNNKDDVTTYNVLSGARYVDNVNIYDYQIAYIRDGKRRVESYEGYIPASGDNVLYVKKEDPSVIITQSENKYVENMPLNDGLVFFTRSGKNRIESLSVYNSGSSTDPKAMKTGDKILFMMHDDGLQSYVNSTIDGVYRGMGMNQAFVSYRKGSAFSGPIYMVNKSYYDANYAGYGSEYYQTGSGLTIDGVTLNDGVNLVNHVVFYRTYNNTSRLCVDELNAYTPQTGDIIRYYKYYDATKVGFTTGEGGDKYTANRTDLIYTNDASWGETSNDVIYKNSNGEISLADVNNFDILLLGNMDNIYYIKKLDKTNVTTYQYTQDTHTSGLYYRLNNVCIDGFSLIKRKEEVVLTKYQEDDILTEQVFTMVERTNSYVAAAGDIICYQVYRPDGKVYDLITEVTVDEETGRLSISLLHLVSGEDIIYKRDLVLYVAKIDDYIPEPDDELVFNANGDPIGENLMRFNGKEFIVDNVGLKTDDMVYLRNKKVRVVRSMNYSSESGDIILFDPSVPSDPITTEGEAYIKTAPAGAEVGYYVNNVRLHSTDIAFFRESKYIFIYQEHDDLSTVTGDKIYDLGYMVVDAHTKFLIKTKMYLTTLDQETSKDLIGATIVASLSIESPDIGPPSTP